MKYLLLLIMSFNLYAFDHSHQKWNSILNNHVARKGSQTLFNYKKIKKNQKDLNSYLKDLSSVKKSEYKKFDKNQKLAFLINSYNAFTVKMIAKNYPVKSIKDIGNFFRNTWKIKFFDFLGEESNLDRIEHGIIRKEFNEPRIHFAVNCASIGCPSLLEEAFVADKLETQLDKAAKNFVENTSKNYIKNKTLYVSSIFKWYGDDFNKTYGSYKKYLEKFFGKKIKKMDVEILDYDWNLNEVKVK